MPNIDPTVRFWIGVVATVILVTAASSSDLTSLFGEAVASKIIHGCAWLGAIFSAVLTMLNGGAMTTSSRIASAAAVDGVKGITVDPKITSVATEAAGANARITTTSPVGRAA